MLRLINKILLLSLLLVMPIQGIAASVSHLQCTASSTTETLDVGSVHQHDGDAAQEHGHESSNDGGNNYAGHLSCHQAASGIPSVMIQAFAGALPDYHPSGFSSARLFFPEQPQRPPRA